MTDREQGEFEQRAASFSAETLCDELEHALREVALWREMNDEHESAMTRRRLGVAQRGLMDWLALGVLHLLSREPAGGREHIDDARERCAHGNLLGLSCRNCDSGIASV